MKTFKYAKNPITPYKKSIFGRKYCNGKLEYYRNTNEFFIIVEHNDICNQKNICK